MGATDRAVACGNCDRALDEPSDLPAEERQPCPVCGSTRRKFFVSLSAHIHLTSSVVAEVTHVPREEVPADDRPEAEAIRGHFHASLDWQLLANGVWLLQVRDANGNVVDGGLGDNADDALLEVYERITPPS